MNILAEKVTAFKLLYSEKVFNLRKII